MAEANLNFIFGSHGNTREILFNANCIDIHANNFTNKGTAFTEEERQTHNLVGSLPPTVRNLESQVKNSVYKVNRKENDIERFVYMRSLYDRNVVLAHAVIQSNIEQFMRIIYTPTAGLACQQYSSMFRAANGLHFYPGNIDQAEKILNRYTHRDIRVAVVTDNQGILGIGDQGAGGIAICLGKLMLYTQGAGIAPWHCLPISLDVGTDNEELLEDKYYLGWRQRRLTGQDYLNFIQQFARAFKTVFPDALCQWEDFSKQNAFAIRDAYLDNMLSFNDDIQGTGAITLAAVITAMKVKNEELKNQVYLVHGAGAGGVGIAEQIAVALMEEGLSEDEARNKIYTLDSRGLVVATGNNPPYKEKFAKDPGTLPWFQDPKHDGDLLSVIKNAGVTVLIGTSGQPGSFPHDVVKAVHANTDRPVILPLSNPTDKCEATPEDLYAWTNGAVLTATGSPFPPITFSGKEIRIGQCNNVFVFPGVGLGAMTSGAMEVLPSFFTAAAKAVSESVSSEDIQQGVLVPPVQNLEEITNKVALAVGLAAINGNVYQPCAFSTFQHHGDPDRLQELITKMRWHPEYLPLIAR